MLMIRFATQAAKPPVDTKAATKPVSANAGPLAGLLPDDLESASAATPAKSGKPRGAKKPKAAADSAAVQLDLDA